MDPRQEGSIGNIALSKDGANYWHKIQLEFLFSTNIVRMVQQERFSELPSFFHNLSAEKVLQKSSMRQGRIMLNSWELLCCILLKHLTFLPSLDSFYQLPFDTTFESDNINDQRLALIILVKLMEYVQYFKVEFEGQSIADVNRFKNQAEQLALVIFMTIGEPVIQAGQDLH